MARPSGDDNVWLIGYADLVTAILAVLIMFMSFTQIDVPKYDELQRLVTRDTPVEPLSRVEAEIREAAENAGASDSVATHIDAQGLTIAFDTAALFEVGSAQLNTQALRPLDEVFNVIAAVGNVRWVDIQGHTDDVQFVDADGWNRNWQLSAERALSLQRHLWRKGLPEQTTRILALADTAPVQPVTGLMGEQLNVARAANRRVSLLVREVRR